MLKVFFADDEREVLEGIKKIVDWQQLGYHVCGEAMDGMTAYNMIMTLNPDLVLMDIKMPKLEGIELASQLRDSGFKGHMIVLSGYSEFKYAQAAMSKGVDFYLTKPIDEDALFDAATRIRQKIKDHHLSNETMTYYKEKAKYRVLEEILQNQERKEYAYSLREMNLEADAYQVLIMDDAHGGKQGYHEFLRALQLPHNSIFVDKLNYETYKIIVLKGQAVIDRFHVFQRDVNEDELTYVLAIGRIVYDIYDTHISYKDAEHVYQKLFFVGGKYRFVTTTMLDKTSSERFIISDARQLGQQLYDLLVVYRKTECVHFLETLEERMMHCDNEAVDIRCVLASMTIFLSTKLKNAYATEDLKLMTNAEIIKTIHSFRYLKDIIDFLKHEIHRVHQLIGGMSSDGILDGIIDYIHHNYSDDIKLKKLAPKFGYNSSYLGKIFAKKMGTSFNDYLHQVRIEEAKKMLLNSTYRIYEIATLLGYKNVDYFHLRFKQFENTTPNEYRISHHIQISEEGDGV